MKKLTLTLAAFFLFNAAAFATVKTKTVEYKQGDTVLEGYLAYDDAKPGPKPAVIIVHDWMGMGPNPKHRAEMVAKLGYVAFAADIYGKGVRPTNGDDAGKLAGKYKGDRKLMRQRIQAAYDDVAAMKDLVNAKKIAVMGYCFGGTVALELARSGAPLAGTVTFHGGLATPTPDDAKNIHGKVLVLHGGDDPYVNADEVKAFQEEMRKAKVDWEFIAYGGAVHSFSIKEAGNDPSKGAAYNANADKKSWRELEVFLKEVM